MEKLFPCRLLEVTDSFLSDAILEMRIDSTKAKCLPLFCNVLNKKVVSKTAIVGMVVTYHDSKFPSECLEGMLRL